MKTQLTQTQIDTYQTNGFLVIEDFLSQQELEQLRTAVGEAVAEMGNHRLTGGDSKWEDKGTPQFTQRINLWKINSTVKTYMQDEKLGKMLCELSGAQGMRVWHDQALIKEPFGNPTAWHLDNPYWSFSAPNSISIWIALDDATYQNGCMWFIPGTQKLARYETCGIGHEMKSLFKMYPEFEKIDPVGAPFKAGSCSFHNGLTAHGAGANMTRGRRRAMTCAYMPEGSTFNGKQNILPQEYFETLKVGDLLNNDEQNPLIYSSVKHPLMA